MTLTKAKMREFHDLGRKKEREASGRFVVDGVRGVTEALRSRFELLELYHTEDLLATEDGTKLVGDAKRKSRAVHLITARDMAKLSDTVTAQGVVAVMRCMAWSVEGILQKDERPSVIVALDAVADPGNLGTAIRTCDWFGVDAILLGQNSVELYNPKVVRSTVGSIFHLPVATGVDLPAILPRAKDLGYAVYATGGDGHAYADEVRYPAKLVLVLGNEAWGVSDVVKGLADIRVAIRRHGAAESLNVSVACGILLAGVRREDPHRLKRGASI